MWLPNKKVVYSVKSGYHTARLLSHEVGGLEGSLRRNDRGWIWQKLWNC